MKGQPVAGRGLSVPPASTRAIAEEVTGEAPRDEPEVVIVEDSPEDYEAIRRTLKKLGLRARVRHFEDGERLVDYLQHRADERLPLPSIVLLDLNMPGTDGREVLVDVQADPRLAGRFPIAVLTTSASEDDIAFCKAHGAASYMTKAVTLSGLTACLDHLRAYLTEGRPLPPRC